MGKTGWKLFNLNKFFYQIFLIDLENPQIWAQFLISWGVSPLPSPLINKKKKVILVFIQGWAI